MRAANVFQMAAVIGATGISSCSLTRFDNDTCQNNGQCRDSFGFGAVCNAQGLCEGATLNKRCTSLPYPDDLFSRPDLYRNAVVIGSLMDHSSAAHVVREKAVRLAVKEVNAAGGIDGTQIAAVFCDIAADNKYDALTRGAGAVAAATFLSDSLGISAIVGPSASADTQQVWEALRGSGTIVMTPAATSPALIALEPTTSDAEPGFLWRVAPPDSLQGAVIAADMLERKVMNVVVTRETGPYGEGLAQVFQEKFKAGGGTTEIISVATDTQIGEAVAQAAAKTATEVLFISSQQDWIIKFLNAASGQGGFAGKGIFLTDAAANQSVITGAAQAGALFPKIRGTRPAPRDANDYVFASFVGNYRAEYPSEDPSAATFSAHAYDGAWLVFYGAAWSLLREGRLTGLGISHGLRKVSEGMAMRVVPSSLQGVIAAFRSGAPVNLSGASGEIDFDPVTKNVTAPIEIWSIGNATGQMAITHLATKIPGG